MSRTSINRNNQAIANIDLAINNYKDAISKINATNENKKAQNIVSLINNCIESLSSVKSKIGGINSQIEIELSKVEQAEKTKNEEEGDADES